MDRIVQLVFTVLTNIRILENLDFSKNQFECFEKNSKKESDLSSQNVDLGMNESGTNGTIQSVTIKDSSFRKIGKSQLLEKNKF